MVPRLLQKGLVPVENLLTKYDLCPAQAVPRVLDKRHPERDANDAQYELQRLGQDFGERRKPSTMQARGTAFLAKADRQHFGQAALDGGTEVGVRLHPVDGDNDVAPQRGLADVDGPPATEVPYLLDLHRRFHRHFQGFGHHTELVQYLHLPWAGSTAVRAHGGDEHRAGAGLAQYPHHYSDDVGEPGNPPAANGHPGPLARLDPVPRYRRPDRRPDPPGQASSVEQGGTPRTNPGPRRPGGMSG